MRHLVNGALTSQLYIDLAYSKDIVTIDRYALYITVSHQHQTHKTLTLKTYYSSVSTLESSAVPYKSAKPPQHPKHGRTIPTA